SRYQLPAAFTDPATFKMAAGPDGQVWFTGYPGAGIGRIMPDGTANYFNQISEQSRTAVGIGSAVDGSMWITDPVGGALVKIVPTTPASVTRFAITAPSGSTKDPQPYAIASGSDGAMWFTDPSTNGIGRAT